MNILIAFSSNHGPSYVAFNTISLNLELEFHRDIANAISFSKDQLKRHL